VSYTEVHRLTYESHASTNTSDVAKPDELTGPTAMTASCGTREPSRFTSFIEVTR